MNELLRQAVEKALNEQLIGSRPLHGGDINDAWAARCSSGLQVFVKSNERAEPRMFACEAAGLQWLASANAIRVPRVLAASSPDDEVQFLALEYLDVGKRCENYEEQLGQRLAALHASGAEHFGWEHDNFIGMLPQDNTPEPAWSTFYAQRRLEPQLRRAIDSGIAPRSWPARFARLFARLDSLCGPVEAPARLHGDLWSGNLLVDERGEPCLIDPAVYGGHREIDLAMLTLFGRPGERFFAAYRESHALAPGYVERVALYQLYPLLVHVNHFGGGYVASVERALARYS